MVSFGRLVEKAKAARTGREALVTDEEGSSSRSSSSSSSSSTKKTRSGFFAVYVGEEKERFVVRIRFLSHPLFKMLLEKASDEFGFEQKSGLVVPCSVSTFREVLDAIEGCRGGFDVTKLLQEFLKLD